ncbi:MAG: RdgB/HAM1 family non-canonical purine NTP pyrophosphatase [Bacilli bacterium]|jgi:XTP/dITP diphosphohydrolase
MELDVIVATTNEEKMREFRHFFYGYSINLSSLKDISLNVPINESGTTFLDNALIKARAVSRYVNKPVLADDSGLQIEALGGFPGLKSSRFMTGSNYLDKMEAIIKMMESHHNRRAQFSCTLVLMHPNGDYRIFIGTACGVITDKIIGANGFGYDPIFRSDELGKSFGEATLDEKHRYSHRGKAVDKAIQCMINSCLIKRNK